MPSVKPFRGTLYNLNRVPIAKVATQPYDKIDSGMQSAYYRRHPHNFIRLILGKVASSDDSKNNRYSRAAQKWAQWKMGGILCRDAHPAFFLCAQRFQAPGMGWRTRLGIVGLLKWEDFSKKGVLPHERTLAKPRKDRLALLKATKANFEQIFLLYDDSGGKFERRLRAWTKKRPLIQFRDENGIHQRLWRMGDARDNQLIERFLSHRKLFIADGHHRYTVAGMFPKQLRSSKNGRGLRANSAWCMATFVSLNSPGMVILPTHRVVKMPPGWNPESLLHTLQRDFQVSVMARKGSLQAGARDLLSAMKRADKQGPSFGLLSQSCMALCVLRQDTRSKTHLKSVLRGPFRALDVAILHRMVLQQHLGLDPKTVERGERIAYIREPEDVARKIASGKFAVAFLQNAPGIDQVKRISLAGECMPQKSTDFYPKLLSGLVMYDMEAR